MFQSTRPRGARPHQRVACDIVMWVSIHAPTWGATHCSRRSSSSAKCFNPRAHVGRDCRASARPGRSRCFNPRAHVGRDLQPQPRCPSRDVSIHAPTWGATSSKGLYSTLSRFQSTRPRGARPSSRVDSAFCGLFQSTRPRGARLVPCTHREFSL